MKLNHTIFAPVCLALVAGLAGPAARAAEEAEPKAEEAQQQLAIGDAVPDLEGVTWVQGEEQKGFDAEGKVYLVECWATWCGPCIAAIPHVNELHTKFQDKGLVVVGMNVWEDGLEKVQDFVKMKKDVMTYNVAYSGGKGSPFQKSWLEAAGVKGIPHAFIVKDGKLVLRSHPAKIDEALIESIMAGSFDPVAHAREQAEQEAEAKKERETIMRFRKEKDWGGLHAYAEKMDDEQPMKGSYLTMALVGQGDWEALLSVRAKAVEHYGNFKPSHVDYQAANMMEAGEGSKAYAEAALVDFAEIDPKGQRAINEFLVKARFQVLAGNPDGAKASLAAAREALNNSEDSRTSQYFGKVLEAAEKAMADGQFPSIMKLMGR